MQAFIRVQVRPVYLAFIRIQSDAVRTDQSSDEGFDVGSVQVGALNFMRDPVRPIYMCQGGNRSRRSADPYG